MLFKLLNLVYIIEILECFVDWVWECFFDVSLNNVVIEVIDFGKCDCCCFECLVRFYIFLCMGMVVVIIGVVILLVYMGYWLFLVIGVDGDGFDIFNIFEGVEVGLNIVILVVVVIFILLWIEEWLK